MNRTLVVRIGGALVVVAILGLLIPVIGPWVGLDSAPKPKRSNVTTDFEPQFTEEGVGAFVAENGDTLAAFRLELAESTAETVQGDDVSPQCPRRNRHAVHHARRAVSELLDAQHLRAAGHHLHQLRRAGGKHSSKYPTTERDSAAFRRPR